MRNQYGANVIVVRHWKTDRRAFRKRVKSWHYWIRRFRTGSEAMRFINKLPDYSEVVSVNGLTLPELRRKLGGA